MSSNLFVKSDLQDVLSSTIDNSSANWLTVNNKQSGGALSATSNVFMSQINSNDINNLVNLLTSDNNQLVGGGSVTSELIPDTVVLSATSAMNNNDDATSELNTMVNQHLNQTFSATSVNELKGGAVETDTEELEAQLRNLLRGNNYAGKKRSSKKSSKKRSKRSKRSSQKGGKKGSRKSSKKASRKGSRKASRKGSKRSSKRRGSKKSLKGGDDELAGGAKRRSKRRSSKKASKKASRKSIKRRSKSLKGGDDELAGGAKRRSRRRSSKKSLKGGNDDELAGGNDELEGGAKRRSKRRSTKKGSKKGSYKGKGASPAFAAALKVRGHVAKALNIPNSKEAVKISFAAIKKVRASNDTTDVNQLAQAAIKEFDANRSKYQKMA